jgi:hypothetical protein
MTLAPNARSLAPRHQPPTKHQSSRIRAYSERAGVPIPTGKASEPASRAPLLLHCTQHTQRACALRKTLEENHPAQSSQPASRQGKARQGKQAGGQAGTAPSSPLFARSRPLAKKPHAQVYHELIRRLPARVALRALERGRGTSTRAHTLRCCKAGQAKCERSAYLLVCLLFYSTGEKRRPPGMRRRGGT